MKTTSNLAFLILLILLIATCKSPDNFEGGNQGGAPMEMKMMDASLPAPSPNARLEGESLSDQVPAPAIINDNVITRKIIKDGRMEVRVKALEQGKLEVDSLVKKYKGYYADETYNNMDFAHGFSMKIRIPSINFEVFMTEVESGVGEVAFKNISSRDVTEEFIDLEARLKNKKNYLNRYGELLKQAKTVKDMLEIEEKTRLIEEEIESVQGRLKYLNNQVDYSTLDLQITKKNDYNAYSNNKGSFIDRLKMSMVKGWFGLVSFTLFVIRLWPFWIIAGVLFYLVRKILRRRKKL